MTGHGDRRLLRKWCICLLISLACSALHAQQQGTVTYFYTDPQGTVLAEADAHGNITATFDYTPYGSTAMGTQPNGPGYTGHINDPETNLVYMQARYYDAVTGHFLSIDPVYPQAGNASNFNRYDYANNNPIRYTDPTGKVVHLVNDQDKIVSLINARAAGTFGVSKDGNLMALNPKGDTSKLSSTYSADLKAAISAKETISISIRSTYQDPKTGERMSVDRKGGGITIGSSNGGDQKVVISGSSYTHLRDAAGGKLRDEPADILAHELGGHAIPHILGSQSGNAVTDENKIRSEVPGSGQRAPEPKHVE